MCATFKTFKTIKPVFCSCFSSWGSGVKFVRHLLYACLLYLLYCFVLTIIHEIYMLKVESNCWNLNLPMCCFNAFYLESIALWVNSYAKLFDACLESTIHEKFFAYMIQLFIHYLFVSNYRPLPWITSFMTCALHYYLIKIVW